ncbi:MAG: DUF2971 domain-containing protein [Nitrosomonadales bacterium]|nr:DUF2971 domain-containing protein [Nitrosomonadales bacterium]
MKLYKYSRYSEHLLSTLVKGTVWLSGPQHFNDIFDCQFQRTNLTKQELSELRILHKHRNSEFEDQVPLDCIADKSVETPPANMIDGEYAEISSFIWRFGILTLSEVSDSLLMWAHYAANHTGLCIEYDVEAEADLGNGSLRPVSYSTEYPTLSIYDFGVDILKTTLRILTTKSMEWAYEKEWRYFENNKKNTEIPSPFEITGVIFGARMKTDQMDTVKKILKGKDVKFSQAQQSTTRFSLDRLKVD